MKRDLHSVRSITLISPVLLPQKMLWLALRLRKQQGIFEMEKYLPAMLGSELAAFGRFARWPG